MLQVNEFNDSFIESGSVDGLLDRMSGMILNLNTEKLTSTPTKTTKPKVEGESEKSRLGSENAARIPKPKPTPKPSPTQKPTPPTPPIRSV